MFHHRPQVGERLARGHRLARGLLLCLPLAEPGTAGFRDLVTGQVWLPDGALFWARDRLGLRGNGVTNQSALTGATATVGTRYTVELLLMRLANTNSDLFNFNAGATQINWNSGLSRDDYAGFTVSAGIGAIRNRWQQLIERGGPGGAELWQDGIRVGSTGTAAPSVNAITRIGAGNGAQTFGDVLGWVRVWDRTLADEELEELSTQPWSMLARRNVAALESTTGPANLSPAVISATFTSLAPSISNPPRTMVADVIAATFVAVAPAVPTAGAANATLAPAVVSITTIVDAPLVARWQIVGEIPLATMIAPETVIVRGGGVTQTPTIGVAVASCLAIAPSVPRPPRTIVAPVASFAGGALVPGRILGGSARPVTVGSFVGQAKAPAVAKGPKAVPGVVASVAAVASPPAVASRRTISVAAVAVWGAVSSSAPTVVRGAISRTPGVGIATAVAMPVARSARTIVVTPITAMTGQATAPGVTRGTVSRSPSVILAQGVALAPARVASRSSAVPVVSFGAGLTAPSPTPGRRTIAGGALPVAVFTGVAVAPGFANGPRTIVVGSTARMTGQATPPGTIAGGQVIATPVASCTATATAPTRSTVPLGAPRWWIDATEVAYRI